MGAGAASCPQAGRRLDATRLTREKKSLVLAISKSHAALYSQSAERDLALLANHLGLEPKMRVMGEKKLPEKGEVALLIDPPA